MARTGSLPVNGPYPRLVEPKLDLDDPAPPSEQKGNRSIEDGVLKIDNPDGTTTIDFNAPIGDMDDDDDESGETEFSRNLAKKLSDDELSRIAADLLEGIQRDEESRKEWLETRAMGISLLGLKLEKPRSDAGSSSAPLEGMSTVRHPLLLEATVSFQATARAELLPAAGPVKVRNDSPYPPSSVVAASLPKPAPPPDPNNPQAAPVPPSAALPAEPSNDELAQALERDFNHYLTSIATEYVP